MKIAGSTSLKLSSCGTYAPGTTTSTSLELNFSRERLPISGGVGGIPEATSINLDRGTMVSPPMVGEGFKTFFAVHKKPPPSR